jgi:poly-gamma-glutamate capsule biosynthesis protein CapA/YwtB (metallophosphatase superfamily)
VSPHIRNRWMGFALACLGVLLAPEGRAQDPTPSVQPLVIAVAGDTLPEPHPRTQNQIDTFLDGVRAEFARADLVFLNLEQPITSSKKATPYKDPALVKAKKDYILHATNPGIPKMLKSAGVGLVGLANNHMMDYMEVGLNDTLNLYREAELPFVGVGLKPDAERAYVFEKYGRRVALLAFSDVVPIGSKATEKTQGIASAKSEEDLTRAIQAARGQADFVVLMIHWGGQGSSEIITRQRQLARVAVQAGSDVVMGMHPHVLQGIEYIDAKPVFYSLGNFAMSSSRAAQRETVLVRLVFGEKAIDKIELVPVLSASDGVPRVAEGIEAEQVLGNLDKLCWSFNSRIVDGRVDMGEIRQAAKPKQTAAKPHKSGSSKAKAASQPGKTSAPKP